MSEDSNSPFY